MQVFIFRQILIDIIMTASATIMIHFSRYLAISLYLCAQKARESDNLLLSLSYSRLTTVGLDTTITLCHRYINNSHEFFIGEPITLFWYTFAQGLIIH